MPQTDADKDTTVLLNEIIAGVPGNFTAVQAKLSELKDNRIIKAGDPDELQVGGLDTTKGAIRPKHQPLVP
jgi:hypothetical protein